jgi:hypothetical protein
MAPRTLKLDLERFERMRTTTFKIAAAYVRLGESLPRQQRRTVFATLGNRVHRCASSFHTAIVRPKHDDPFLRVSNRGSCNWKLCPLCARRLAWKRQELLAALLLIAFTRRPGMHVKFATWTLRNEPIADCERMFARIKDAVAKLLAQPLVQPTNHGAWVQFECPIRKDGQEAGWHAHALLLCDGSSEFLHFTEWQKLLKHSAGLDYTPMVGIELARGRVDDTPYNRALNAARDAAKYVCAPLALLEPDTPEDLFDDPATMPLVGNDNALRWLTLAVYKKQLHRCTGLWAEALTEHRATLRNRIQCEAGHASSPAPF